MKKPKLPSRAKLGRLLAFAEELTLRPGGVTSDTIRELERTGLTREEIRDAAAVTAVFNLYNRWIDGAGLPGMPGERGGETARRAREAFGESAANLERGYASPEMLKSAAALETPAVADVRLDSTSKGRRAVLDSLARGELPRAVSEKLLADRPQWQAPLVAYAQQVLEGTLPDAAEGGLTRGDRMALAELALAEAGDRPGLLAERARTVPGSDMPAEALEVFAKTMGVAGEGEAPDKLEVADLDRARAAGMSEEQLKDLVRVGATFSFIGRLFHLAEQM